MAKTRKKIPTKIADDVVTKSDSCCCVCEEEGVHIHHIDGNPSNNEFDNLVFLCFKHHNEVSKRGGLSRGLTAGVLKQYRDRWYEKVESKHRIPVYGTEGALSESAIFQLVLDASVILEVRRVGEQIYSGNKEDRAYKIERLASYIDLSGLRARKEILKVLDTFTFKTRIRMSGDIASSVAGVASDALPIQMTKYPRESQITQEEFELFEYGLAIATFLTYDGSLYARNINVVDAGAELLWKILAYATINKHEGLKKRALETFSTGEDGATRSGDADFVSLLKLYKDQGLAGSWSYPEYNKKLSDRLSQDD